MTKVDSSTVTQLLTMANLVDDAPKAPALPDWCFEEEDEDDDVGRDASNFNDQRRRREFQKANPTFMEGIDGVSPVLPGKAASIQQICQRLAGG